MRYLLYILTRKEDLYRTASKLLIFFTSFKIFTKLHSNMYLAIY